MEKELSIKSIMLKAHHNSTNKGFWDTEQTFGESIALIHSELSEALEDFRAGKKPDALEFEANGKPVGIPSELADAVIRIADLSAYWGIDLEKAIDEKMNYNLSRPYMHGKIL